MTILEEKFKWHFRGFCIWTLQMKIHLNPGECRNMSTPINIQYI